MKKLLSTVLSLGCLLAAQASSGAPTLKLSLAEMVKQAMLNSNQLTAAELDWHAAQRRSDLAGSALLPYVGAQGSWSRVSIIPSLSLFPNQPPMQFGDYQNYNYGLAASWTVWDWLGTFNSAESNREAAWAKEQQWRTMVLQTVLTARLAYFQVQANLEQVRLASDSLKLAQSQYRDVDLRYHAGTASKIDELSAHQEVLTWQRQFRQAQADLAGSLRTLYSLTGLDPQADLSLPYDSRLAGNMPDNIGNPTVFVALDNIQDSAKILEPGTHDRPDNTLPQVQIYQALSDSFKKLGWSADAAFLPRFQVQATAGYQYPNGPVLETIQQNTVAVSASMPLWDWGRTINQSAEARDQSLTYEKQRDQSLTDLGRNWDMAQDQLQGLLDQQKLNNQYVSEAEQLAKLVYQSYQSGRSSFLDVQSANLREMEAKVQSVRTDIQVLIQMATLSALSKGGSL